METIKKTFIYTQNASHPFNGKGTPAYTKTDLPEGIYEMETTYRVDGNKTHDSISLFHKKSSWLAEGISSRIFPTLSTEKFHNEFKNILFSVLLRKIYSQKELPAEEAEDYYAELFFYFIKKTSAEQLEYQKLTSTYGSYFHYPLRKSFRTHAAVIKGLLSIFYMKIDSLLSRGRKKESNIEDLNHKAHLYHDSPEEEVVTETSIERLLSTPEFLNICELFFVMLNNMKIAMNRKALKGFIFFLSTEGKLAKRVHDTEKYYKFSFNKLKRSEHKILSTMLPSLISNTDKKNGHHVFSNFLQNASTKQKRFLIQKIALNLLEKKTDL